MHSSSSSASLEFVAATAGLHETISTCYVLIGSGNDTPCPWPAWSSLVKLFLMALDGIDPSLGLRADGTPAAGSHYWHPGVKISRCL
jgi:hypothetical protein